MFFKKGSSVTDVKVARQNLKELVTTLHDWAAACIAMG